MDIVKLLQGVGVLFVGQRLGWFQLYGPLKIDWLKGNNWFIYGIAIPISYIFLVAIKLCTEAFEGNMYPSRFLTFSLGIISFAILTWYFNNEGINMKVAVSLILALSLVCVQVFWK
jgi:hypothetical protein